MEVDLKLSIRVVCVCVCVCVCVHAVHCSEEISLDDTAHAYV